MVIVRRGGGGGGGILIVNAVFKSVNTNTAKQKFSTLNH